MELRHGILRSGVTGLSLLLCLSAVWAGQVELVWTLPTATNQGSPLDDLTGAKVYYGTSSSNYTTTIDVGLTNRHTVTGLESGTTYYFNGTAYNAQGLESEFCNEVVKTATLSPGNHVPEVSAGPDRETALGIPFVVDGTVLDDGLPAGSTLLVTWSKVSGPGTVTFEDNSDVDTAVSFSKTGQYVLQIKAFDGDEAVKDDVTITVYAALVPSPPANLRVLP